MLLLQVGVDKSKIRCFNCHEPGHLARNCNNPQVKRNQTLAQPTARNSERAVTPTNTTSAAPSGTSSNSALVVQPNAAFDWNTEIQHLNLTTPENQTPTNTMAFITQVHGLTSEEVNSYLCTPECRGRVATYRLHNSELISDLHDIKRHNFALKKNKKLHKEK
ncbi:putative transcription factor interactor and regulator CCHC(Zn) family [Helianthus anomalus]